MTFGFIRSVTYDEKVKSEYYNRNTRSFEVKQMLIVDRIGRVIFNTCAAVTVWPWMLRDDLVKLECRVRDKDSVEYGYERS